MVRIRGPRCGLLHASSGWLATDTRTLSSGQACRARPSSPRAPLLQRHYPPSLLLRAHAQIPVPLISISCFALIEDALAACTTHGWSPGPSRFGPPFFPEVLRPLYRRFDECIQPVLPRRLRPSPLYPGLGSPQSSRKRLPAGFPFRYGRHSFMLRPTACLPSWPFGTFTWHLRTYTSELAVDSLPPRPSDMLPGRLVNCRGWTFTSKKGSRCRLHGTDGNRSSTRSCQQRPRAASS